MHSQETTLQDFSVIERLGSGSFATVYKVQRKGDQRYYAMKKVKIGEMKEKQKQNALNQVRILASIQHPNIANYKEAFFDSKTQTLCVVMEFADAGDLQKKINKKIQQHTKFHQREIWDALIQMARGLKALHQINILHRDLKCANVFCTSDRKYKLGDLNVSKVSKEGRARTQTGTPYYTSPEVWKDKEYNSKCDIWSLGCVIYQMATLNPPFRASNLKQLYCKIQRGIYPRINDVYSEELRKVVNVCLQVNPDSRPSAYQLLELPLVKSKMSTEDFYSQNNYEPAKANLLKTIQVPRNLKSLREALPKSKYETQKLDLSKQKERQLPRMISQRRYVRNNSAQLLGKQIPRVIFTPKNEQGRKQQLPQYLFRRPSSNSQAREPKSQLRDMGKPSNIPATRISRNNSVDSIRRRVESSRVQRVQSIRGLVSPNQNNNINNIYPNNSKVVQKIDQKVNKFIERLPGRTPSRERVLSREKVDKVKNDMDDITNRCRQIQNRVQGLINRKKQPSRVVALPYISERRPGINIPRVDSRNRLLSANRQYSNNQRQKSMERPPSRQKSFQKVSRSVDRSQEGGNSGDKQHFSRKRYLYQANPKIR